jgi:hypothetical protein
MWENRIKLERFVYHDDARKKIQNILDEKGVTDECITDLHISADGGYVYYIITLGDNSTFTVFDNGNVI